MGLKVYYFSSGSVDSLLDTVPCDLCGDHFMDLELQFLLPWLFQKYVLDLLLYGLEAKAWTEASEDHEAILGVISMNLRQEAFHWLI